ncbi:MAG: ABC transporter substrate-binding protein [Deltaproteobacteria bacterium]|nr:ABC transporter substrate-binding protein [Deltaproteobacteria bacterium]
MRKTGLIIIILIFITIFFSLPLLASNTIKIGATFPLSGKLAKYGEGFKMAVDLAVEEINQKGGINGKKLEIIYEDNKSTANDSVSAIRKLINVYKLPIIFGPAASSNFLAVCPIAQANKTVLIGAESAAAAISKCGDYVFRVFPSDKLQGAGVAKLTLSLGYKEVPVMYINNDWGAGLKDVFKEKYLSEGGKITQEIPYAQGKSDYRTELIKATKNHPKAIVNLTYFNEGAIMFKQAYQMGIKTQWIVGSAAKSPKLIELAGKRAVEGIIGTYPTFSHDTPQYKHFLEAWKKKYHTTKIPIFAEFNYDMTNLAAKAIAKGGYTADGIKKALFEVSKGYIGVTGDKTFDKNGDVGSEYGRWTIKDGKIVDLK